jgi:predicted  nucleic acid-binding Zn-ribbon protein
MQGSVLAASLLAATVLAGCANKPMTREQIGEGRTAISTAQAAGATSASGDITTARNRLAEAEAAAKSGDHVKARRLADEAEADALLARSQATRDKSEKAAAEVDKGLAALREEMTRASSVTTSPVKP